MRSPTHKFVLAASPVGITYDRQQNMKITMEYEITPHETSS